VADVVPAAALVLGAGETGHPEVAAEGLAVRYEAELVVARAGRYRLALEARGGRGRIEVEQGGRRAEAESSPGELGARTDWLELARGAAWVRVEFRRDGADPAALRTLWEQELTPRGGFPPEPIPPRAARVPAGRGGEAAAARRAVRGRLLLEEKGCTACHAAGRAAAALGRREAPRLAGSASPVGAHDARWLERWILAPDELVPGSAMPRLLGPGAEAREEARDLAHFVAAGAGPPGPLVSAGVAPDGEGVVAEQAGAALYHRVGCVACHGAFEPPRESTAPVPAASPPVPPDDLGAARGKWEEDALARFLVDPLASRPDGRMPSLGLDPAEAASLARYLVGRLGGAGAPIAPEPERVARGRAAFERRGCGACHAGAGLPVGGLGRPLAELDPTRGCLDPADRATPRYDLTADERELLRDALARVGAVVGDPAPLDATRRTLERLACRACHPLDGEGGPPPSLAAYFGTDDESVDLGDEGRLPPDLGGVGFKLRSDWLAEVLEHGARARPYLSTRMPRFGAAVRGLERGLAAREGVDPGSDDPLPAADLRDVNAARDLVWNEFRCVACHVYKDYPPLGSPGPALTDFAERLRFAWAKPFLQNPQRFLPGGRMPDFGTGGKSSASDVLGGDMVRQIDALWAYFALGDGMSVPEGIELSGSMSVRPGERAVVLRAFLPDAGVRGIAVGTPGGLHFSFDAEALRVAAAWRGEFLDASGSWSGRGGEPLGGRGPSVWTPPAGPSLRLAPAGASPPARDEGLGPSRFRGYRLDAAGVPTFLYEVAHVAVAERFAGRLEPEPRLVRTFELAGLAAGTDAWLPLGPRRDRPAVRTDPPEAAVLVERDGATWLRVPGGAPRVHLEVELAP